MKIIKIYFLVKLLFLSSLQYSQSIRGVVYSDIGGVRKPLEDAVVKWINTTRGTITDKEGKFQLKSDGITDFRLIVFLAGFMTDTVIINEGVTDIEIVLKTVFSTDEIKVEDRRRSTTFGNYIPKTEIISSKELVKAACCDLSGCFGRNSSVDVAVTDILTDSKELKILGLEGVYTQILTDNLPVFHGYNVKYGISSVPGTSIDKITISKGSNSVIWGYESISGIMNVILKDYEKSDKLMINGFINSMLEKQVNLNYAGEISSSLKNIFMFHTTQKSRAMDDNGDGFLDNPLITRYVIFDKMNFSDNKKRTEFHLAARYWNERRESGQKYTEHGHGESVINRHYDQDLRINSYEGYFRFSREFNKTSNVKIYGSSSYYDQKSLYGITNYNARQTLFNLMGFYEFEITEDNFLKTGLSYKFRKANESIWFSDTTSRRYDGVYENNESIPGLFAENSLNLFDNKLSVMSGVRLDRHNRFNLIFTPRILLRYQPDDAIVLRLSAGTGFRNADIINEHINILASSRDVVILEELKAERMFNYGANVIYYFSGRDISGNFNFDVYRTEFSNKIIADYDSSPSEVIFSNLKGSAYSNVIQSELNVTLFRSLDIKIAHKFIVTKYDYLGRRYEQAFNPRHRFQATFSWWSDDNLWGVNAGLNWYASQRLPSTSNNPPEYRLSDRSDPYTILNMQLNRNFKYFELYAGVENLLNFRQHNPIISAEDPFGPYFDTSFIWGPTKGRELYAGFRFILR